MTSRIPLLTLALVACGGDDETPTDPTDASAQDTDTAPDPSVATGDTGTPAPVVPTWNEDVASIVYDQCVSCHQDDGIGSFSLEDFATAQAWGPAMADAVADRRMPPWLVTDDGSCNDFADSRWMDDADIQRIADWVDAGMPEGDPANGPTSIPPLASLDRVDMTVSTPSFVPEVAGGVFAPNDEYRCFMIPNPAGTDTFLTGYDVIPGNNAIVHHVLGMPVDPAAPGWDGQLNGVHMANMDGADGRDGWECFGTAGGNIREDGVPVVWAPGQGAVEYPDDVGVHLGATDVLVVQVHYNLVDPATHGQSDATTIHLRTEDQVADEAMFVLPDDLLTSMFLGAPVAIPAGEAAWDFTFQLDAFAMSAFYGAPQPPYDILGVMPHMHGLGTAQTMRRIPASGADECLVDVPDWDFDWQLFYFYEQPTRVEAGDTLEITCTYDTTSVTEPTYPGWGTMNEMCLVSLMIVPR